MQTAALNVWEARQIGEALAAAGFLGVPLWNPTSSDPARAKVPVVRKWQEHGLNPTFLREWNWRADATGIGLLAYELRIVDVDLDEAQLANEVEQLAGRFLGEAPKRTRRNSSRFALVYRANEGAPGKRMAFKSTPRDIGNVEVLGAGQFLCAAGLHPSGERWEWSQQLGSFTRDSLTAITESQLDEFLDACRDLLAPGHHSMSPNLPETHSEAAHITVLPRSVVSDRERAYAQGSLKAKAEELTGMMDGRNRALNTFALQMGEMAGAGWITSDEVGEALLQASYDNGEVEAKGLDQTKATLESGFAKGFSQPCEPLWELPLMPHIDLIVAEAKRFLEKFKSSESAAVRYLPAQGVREHRRHTGSVEFRTTPGRVVDTGHRGCWGSHENQR